MDVRHHERGAGPSGQWSLASAQQLWDGQKPMMRQLIQAMSLADKTWVVPLRKTGKKGPAQISRMMVCWSL